MKLAIFEKIDPLILGTRLKNLRQANKLTQKNVANYIGTSVNSYLRWEQGLIQSPNPGHLNKLSALYNCKLSKLLDPNPDVQIDESEPALCLKEIPLLTTQDFNGKLSLEKIPIKDKYSVPILPVKEDGNIFAFHVSASTMEGYQSRRTIPLNSTAICSTKFVENALNECPVVYSINAGPASIREYVYIDDKSISLRAWNEQYRPITVEKNKVLIFGIVKNVIIDF